VRIPGDKGANASGKVAAIVAGRLTGADSIDDLDVIRHGGKPALFGSVYAPSTMHCGKMDTRGSEETAHGDCETATRATPGGFGDQLEEQ
jgi:hypothetical protein